MSYSVLVQSARFGLQNVIVKLCDVLGDSDASSDLPRLCLSFKKVNVDLQIHKPDLLLLAQFEL